MKRAEPPDGCVVVERVVVVVLVEPVVVVGSVVVVDVLLLVAVFVPTAPGRRVINSRLLSVGG